MLKSYLSLAFLSLLLIGRLASAQETAPKKFVYKKVNDVDLSLNVYQPPEWSADKKLPAIVFFFGGGWTGGKIEQFESQSKHLASRGMVAICADYRVKSRHGVKPDACVQDAKSAIRWVRQNAAKLGIDPQRIVGAGGSAGGHLAACTALCPGLDLTEENQDISSKPNVLVLYNPVLNFNVANLTDRIGGDEQLAKAISPTQHLAANSQPTLLMYGKDDKLLAQGEEYEQAAKKLVCRCELMTVEGVGHGFFNRPPHLQATTARVDAFLVSLGYLPPATSTESKPAGDK
ncbi:alpha/beta hydrolase [Anatilimnocola floriformis]|uniref:alpha/beta hydrolase n=1 Tax=Anatilimnocola floriformis TaxID=2948575 RepID=UPI0020C50FEF|nr:alpha/beta hydrolase [Anatilimnocola floriformis]